MAGKYAGFGEIMLRLSPAGKKRFMQVLPGELEALFGGGEANVCVSLAMLGADSRYLTALPENPVTRAFACHLRGIGVDISKITYANCGRLGVYYAEHGTNMRGSNVIYDRDGSTISLLHPHDYDFDGMLDGVTNLHLTGITPSLSEPAFQSTLALAQAANRNGVGISVDLNYRKKLWNWRPGTAKQDLAGECMAQIVALADVIIGNEEDASDVFGIRADNTSVESGKLNIAGYEQVARRLNERFPRVRQIGITLRESYSADHNNWGGMLYDCASRKAFFAPLDEHGAYAPYEMRNIMDRFGGGDSFCAGLLFGLEKYGCGSEAIRFAVAASALKHTIRGDFNYISKEEVLSLMNGNAYGRVKR